MRIEDIAKKAGVSRSTVSRVLNNAPDVSEKTRQKVNEIIRELGYQPNPIAQMLASQRNRVLGVVIRSRLDTAFGDPNYFPTLLQGISDAVAERDYLTLIWMGTTKQEDQQFHQRVVSTSLIDGIVLASAEQDDILIEQLLNRNIPFVMVEKPNYYLEQIHYISIDNHRATHTAIQYLLEHGYKQIGILQGNSKNPDFLERLAGYEQALQQANIPINPDFILQDIRQISKQVVQGMDALFAVNDKLAIDAINFLRQQGINVPDDLAVIGFDDLPTASTNIPALTTIHHPIYDKGFTAAQVLIDLLQGRREGIQHIQLSTNLVVRDSA